MSIEDKVYYPATPSHLITVAWLDEVSEYLDKVEIVHSQMRIIIESQTPALINELVAWSKMLKSPPRSPNDSG